MRYRCALIIVSCLAFLGWTQPVLAFEQINSFHSTFTINQDTSLTVKEKIEYETDLDKHGIYRYIPYQYQRHGLTYTLRIRQEQITDEDGEQLQYERSVSSGNVTYKIGDPDTTFSGKKTYIITYTVENAVTQFEDRAELYWDITGEGWEMPITETRATINSPHAKLLKAECFAGPFGRNDGACRAKVVSPNQVTIEYDEEVAYGDNVTAGITLDVVNNLVFPTSTQKLIRHIQDNAPLVPLIVPPFILGYWWWKRGRDRVFISPNVFENDERKPQSFSWGVFRRQPPMVYEPLKALTPGEAGVMLNEKADNQDVVAEIIELARKKYLKIERTEKKKLLGLASETDYIFTKLKAADGTLPESQYWLQTKIFDDDVKTVKLSKLKGSFYSEMERVKELLFESVTKKKLFTDNPGMIRGWALGIAVALEAAASIWMFMRLEQGQWLSVPLVLVTAPFTFIFANAMPSKTAKGSNWALQALGLQATIQRGAWREKLKERDLFVEEVLPFAISLGVVDKLSRDMEDLNVKPPEYLSGYSGSSFGRGLAFNSFISDFSTSAGSSLSYNPSSSSSGGSFSGGGSSGGGGGGGGGGSW